MNSGQENIKLVKIPLGKWLIAVSKDGEVILLERHAGGTDRRTEIREKGKWVMAGGTNEKDIRFVIAILPACDDRRQAMREYGEICDAWNAFFKDIPQQLRNPRDLGTFAKIIEMVRLDLRAQAIGALNIPFYATIKKLLNNPPPKATDDATWHQKPISLDDSLLGLHIDDQ